MAQMKPLQWACSRSELLSARNQKGTCYVIDTNAVSKVEYKLSFNQIEPPCTSGSHIGLPPG